MNKDKTLIIQNAYRFPDGTICLSRYYPQEYKTKNLSFSGGHSKLIVDGDFGKENDLTITSKTDKEEALDKILVEFYKKIYNEDGTYIFDYNYELARNCTQKEVERYRDYLTKTKESSVSSKNEWFIPILEIKIDLLNTVIIDMELDDDSMWQIGKAEPSELSVDDLIEITKIINEPAKPMTPHMKRSMERYRKMIIKPEYPKLRF